MREKALVIGYDGFDGRLLEHDLAQPDGIWVWTLAGQAAPGKGAAVVVVPAQQGGCIRSHGNGYDEGSRFGQAPVAKYGPKETGAGA
ncbi:hypothetical protein GCM10007866_25800 [Gluconobacter albidus]|uniref:Uncharacterized protein n=1 Tax=Gluconobacter albidus TaxID=318683 RepID=A0ABQ5X490_9PROT|nr:hypothetical protein GCM10007866_25800 [Gluconobacter albidus]